eukprot:1223281-Pyramimonas_sp.AAC.1
MPQERDEERGAIEEDGGGSRQDGRGGVEEPAGRTNARQSLGEVRRCHPRSTTADIPRQQTD